MPVRLPTPSQLRHVAEDLGMTVTDADTVSYLALMRETIAAYNIIDSMPDYVPEVKYSRTPGYRPEKDENRFNAWCVKTSVGNSGEGKLAGKRVVLKDSICLAGVPMMNGASILEGYVPGIDATIVTRILDAGGEIVGKAVCEYFGFSGGSHTSATGPVQNPRKPGYSAGGSSSGCAALVAAGDVDMAIGGDQGGSIRIPSSFCGIYGMKPTYGLVPYTGIMSIDLTLDHAGPMTSNVTDNALLLEAIAGSDGIDPRQCHPPVARYTEALTRRDLAGLKIGVVSEGFGHQNSEPDVDKIVKLAAARYRKLGAFVKEVSLPMHRIGAAIWTPIILEGAVEGMMKGNGFGTNHKGLFITSLIDALAGWRHRADELSETLKLSMLIGQYTGKHYRGRYYAKAQNLARKLRAAYDAALENFDLLLMPTLPIAATPIPAVDAPREEIIQRAFEMTANTSPFDVTGHPAMSIPCGMIDARPVGMMLIARHYGESVIYNAAYAFEQSEDWQQTGQQGTHER